MRKYKSINKHIDQEDNDDNSIESGLDSLSHDTKTSTSTSSAKRSKRGTYKRVILVPIKEIEGSRLKSENTPPPSDSWTWRKYGQKPIKGSPYPRGYYKCSSSKGCPARKQVERSRSDPTMLVVTYSCEHNHPWPLPSKTKSRTKPENTTQPETPEEEPEPEPEPELELESNEEKPASVDHEDSLVTTDDFSWFGDMNSASSTILENPIFTSDFDSSYKPNNKSYINIVSDNSDMNFFPMREEDELLFADLGELPECSTVFNHHRGVGPQVQIC